MPPPNLSYGSDHSPSPYILDTRTPPPPTHQILQQARAARPPQTVEHYDSIYRTVPYSYSSSTLDTNHAVNCFGHPPRRPPVVTQANAARCSCRHSHRPSSPRFPRHSTSKTRLPMCKKCGTRLMVIDCLYPSTWSLPLALAWRSSQRPSSSHPWTRAGSTRPPPRGRYRCQLRPVSTTFPIPSPLQVRPFLCACVAIETRRAKKQTTLYRPNYKLVWVGRYDLPGYLRGGYACFSCSFHVPSPPFQLATPPIFEANHTLMGKLVHTTYFGTITTRKERRVRSC